MTTVYFVRHAEPNYSNHDDLTRELSSKGLADCQKLIPFFQGKPIDGVFSSPYLRAVDTVKPLADSRNLPIVLVEEFRERKVSDGWLKDFDSYARKQWTDFSWKLPGGESLGQTQSRNISALNRILSQYSSKTLVIGSHGTAISTILHYYDPSFGYGDFEDLRSRMPLVAKLTFDGLHCTGIQRYAWVPAE